MLKRGKSQIRCPPTLTISTEMFGKVGVIGLLLVGLLSRTGSTVLLRKLEFARSQNLKSGEEWRELCKLGNKPQDMPYNPDQVYKNQWIGWGDWLATGRVANQIKGWSIEKVKELLRGLIESKTIYDWDEAGTLFAST